MATMYKKSAQTLVWLGEDDGTVGEAYNTITDLTKEMDQEMTDIEKIRAQLYSSNVFRGDSRRPGAHLWHYPTRTGPVVGS